METLSLNRVLKGPVYLVLYSSVMLYTCHLTFLQWLLTMWKRHLSGAGVWFVHLCHPRTTVEEDILPHTFNSCQYIPPQVLHAGTQSPFLRQISRKWGSVVCPFKGEVSRQYLSVMRARKSKRCHESSRTKKSTLHVLILSQTYGRQIRMWHDGWRLRHSEPHTEICL